MQLNTTLLDGGDSHVDANLEFNDTERFRFIMFTVVTQEGVLQDKVAFLPVLRKKKKRDDDEMREIG